MRHVLLLWSIALACAGCSRAHGVDAGRDAYVPFWDSGLLWDAYVPAQDTGVLVRDGGVDAGGSVIDACVPFVCGDGTCTIGGENCSMCPRDCGPCPCGDGVCYITESCSRCPSDCGDCPCGDGMCNVSAGETCASCAADCDCACGDGYCGPREWEICPPDPGGDCGFVDLCGNFLCEDRFVEDCVVCPIDCCCR